MISIRFRNPERNQVVIFDHAGSEILERTILEGIDHQVLHARYEVLHVTFHIVFLMLKNMQYIQLNFSRNIKKSFRQLFGNLYRIYLLSCIEYMRPKLVLTWVDNSYAYQFISRRYKGAYFLAIQNGIRCGGDLRDWLPPLPEPGSTISMPLLFCFGEYERELYKKYNHQVDTMHPIGSLKAGFYRTKLAPLIEKKEFDVCLISQWSENIMEGICLPEIAVGLKKLDDYLKRYLDERKCKICVALRSNQPKEEQYFISKYGNRVHFVRHNSKEMSSYRAIDNSRVVMAFDSTLAREAFGWGAKVLFCNLSGDDLYTFPYSGFWSLTRCTYEVFKDRLDFILSLKDEEYASQIKATAAYVMNYNSEKPPHVLIKNMILEKLNKGDDVAIKRP